MTDYENTALQLAKRCGRFTSMLMIMAREGRLKDKEMERLKEELGKGNFSDDAKLLHVLECLAPKFSHFTEEEIMPERVGVNGGKERDFDIYQEIIHVPHQHIEKANSIFELFKINLQP